MLTNVSARDRIHTFADLMQSVAFHTLGCKLNFSETSTIARQFRSAGWKRVEFTEVADVYVINTCSVTENADRECKMVVNRALQLNKDSKIIIVGCYAQLKPHEIALIPGVSLVLGATEKFNVLNYLAELDQAEKAIVKSCDIEEADFFTGSWSSGDRTRAFLKVQDGCDYNCSFCTLPLARGRSRSNTIAGVLDQVRELVDNGVQEIVLTGVNLGDFGIREIPGRHDETFTELAAVLEKVDGLNRVRISSIEPNLLTEDLISLVARSQRFMPHFHIPLQSGSDVLLGKMRRRYKTELYASRVAEIRKQIPHAAIGVDVIVGFPGETDALFRETFDFLHSIDVSYLHVFTYSERNDTAATGMQGVVPPSVRKERNRILRSLSALKLHDFTTRFIGTDWPVLFEEEEKSGRMFGYTSNYIRVEHAWKPELVNRIVNCRLGEINSNGFVASEVLSINQTPEILAV